MTSPDIQLVGISYVLEVLCKDCGGVPDSDRLPPWTYDEFDECNCPVGSEDKPDEAP